MSKHTKYEHGSFSWADAGTTDATAAKKFYGGLFGWTFQDTPAGPGATYTMCFLEGAPVCALYEMPPEMKGMPPHWMTYISVDDVEATTKKAATNGGKVMKEPFDVMEHGRMSVIQDPSGAIVSLWQPKAMAGAAVKDEPGSLTWAELYTTNVDAAGKFYVNTIGWKTASHDMGPMGVYTLFNRTESKDSGVGGMMAMPAEMKGVPSNWITYFAVSDVDASTKKATDLGGKVLAPPMDIPNIGRFSMVQDPQGAAFALYKNAH